MTYLSLSGLLAGVDPDISFYLLSIANACSLLGRLGGGVLADRYGELHQWSEQLGASRLTPSYQTGAMNVMIPGTLVAGAMTYAWPFAKTEGPLIAVSVLYGCAPLFHPVPSLSCSVLTQDTRFVDAVSRPGSSSQSWHSRSCAWARSPKSACAQAWRSRSCPSAHSRAHPSPAPSWTTPASLKTLATLQVRVALGSTPSQSVRRERLLSASAYRLNNHGFCCSDDCSPTASTWEAIWACLKHKELSIRPRLFTTTMTAI